MYQEREFAPERQNYWSRDRQEQSAWQGKLAEQRGLVGAVGNEHLGRPKWRRVLLPRAGMIDS
jgi:hypothetical protein